MLGWFGDHCAFLCGDVGVASAWLSPCFVSALRFRVQASSLFVQRAIKLQPASLFIENFLHGITAQEKQMSRWLLHNGIGTAAHPINHSLQCFLLQ